MLLKSDGPLCIMRPSIEASKSITPEDFLGGGLAMALSLDSSSFYYGSTDGHGDGQDQATYLQPLHYAVILGLVGTRTTCTEAAKRSWWTTIQPRRWHLAGLPPA
ncbi:unnamed protein product, partial [Urochloa humidicola]